MLHTQPWTGAEFYRLFAELTQSQVGHNFRDNNEVWASVNSEQKILFQGTIKASVLEDNMCESRGIKMQLNLHCSFWGCKYRLLILCNVNSLSYPFSHITSHQPSKATELIVLMVTKSGKISILEYVWEPREKRNMYPTLPSSVMPYCAVDDWRVMWPQRFQIFHSTRVRFFNFINSTDSPILMIYFGLP